MNRKSMDRSMSTTVLSFKTGELEYLRFYTKPVSLGKSPCFRLMMGLPAAAGLRGPYTGPNWRNRGMKFEAGKNGRLQGKPAPDSDSFITHTTWSDRDRNSDPQRWKGSVLSTRSRSEPRKKNR